jgi:hypothetical protein
MYASICEWENLWLAWRKARRGKRATRSAAAFEFQVADRLVALQDDLLAKRYRPGPYVHFTIHEPKRRTISASPFGDRVVHHALCNVIEPHFEARFHPHSYANRRGKGTHAAIDQAQHFARRHRYVLRMDIVQHFPSLDHAVLRAAIARVVTDTDTLWLVDTILASGAGVLANAYDMVYFPGDNLLAATRPRGLPIGNLTSQFWSNVYLDQLDWFVTHRLGCRAYLRYVDDFALFADSKRQLWAWKAAIMAYLATLRLTVHERAAQVQPVVAGIPWLGFVVYPTHRLLKRRNVVRFSRRFVRNLARVRAGEIGAARLTASVQGWVNHVRWGNTWGLRRRLLRSNVQSSVRLLKSTGLKHTASVVAKKR